MGIKLNWKIDEDEDRPPEVKERQLPVSSLVTILGVLVLAAVAFGVWRYGEKETAEAEEDLRQQVQAALDRERAAVEANDGELFLSYYETAPPWVSVMFQPGDLAWLSFLLQPRHLAVLRAGPTVTRVEQQGSDIYTNIEWMEGGRTWQRITFYQELNGRLIHVPYVPAYWGQVIHSHQEWGDLFVHEQDQEWTNQIAKFMTAQIQQICVVEKSSRCDGREAHLSLTIAADYFPTAAPNQLRVPSPRLLALDESGQPGEPFWEQLRLALADYLAPVIIQFAVPEAYATIYETAAESFTAEQPGITVEIVPIEAEEGEPLAWAVAEGVDGAAITPDERALAAGWVFDLTDFVETDTGFDQADFYEQIWRGAWWRERMWFMPERAAMQLLFYDKESYRAAEIPEPSLRWTWDEMAQDLSLLRIPQPRPIGTTWGFLDVTRDSLYSYAYNWENNCVLDSAVQCSRPLDNSQITAALEWYQGMLSQPDVVPDLTTLSASERQRMMVNWRAVFWVDAPVHYEFRLLIDPLGVVPFPGSDRFDGITPLAVSGSFISSSSDNPRATWEWLKFLTYQSLNRQQRLVPARPSVASDNAYWNILPRPLSNAMRTAFPFARPITIEEQSLFSWEQLAAVASGELSPQEAARIRPRTPWFTEVEN
jgi:ABC-type glycerol-3-phosphate transport system substrate-binding protein